MDDEVDLKKFRKQRELNRNNKRLEEIKTEREILESRNVDLKKALGIKETPRQSRNRRGRDWKKQQAQRGAQA